MRIESETVVVWVTIGGMIALVILVACVSNARRPEQYEAWKAATGNTNLTFEQWNDLRSAGLLPGQSQHSTTVVPVPVIVPSR